MHTRRQFLALGAVVLAAPALNARGANEKLTIGLIGSGNRGRTIIRECIKLGHHVVAASDIAKFRQEAITDTIVKDGQPKPVVYDDYRKLLDHKGLDAVVIATPDHHHREQLLAAMDAGKHAYIEKPLSHTIEQGKEMNPNKS